MESANIETESSPILFEEGYLTKSSRLLTSTPDLALTEFVANAWDAGACNVWINIPNEVDGEISIEDDGIGMSDDEFNKRWMTLGYDRQSRQGSEVVFPSDVISYKRVAYGRNGVGRHGMLCFADDYKVLTWRDGISGCYSLRTSSAQQPLKIYDKVYGTHDGHGTRISTKVKRHLPDVQAMIDIIAARFMYDPRFIVHINGKTVDLLEHKGLYDTKHISLKCGVNLDLVIVDSTKTSYKSQQHGIAFWICGRLVGQPSWTIGNTPFLDGRFRAAKRFTIIIKTDDLINDVLPDWTGFVESANIKAVYSELKQYIDSFLYAVMSDQIVDLQNDVIQETREQLEYLAPYEKREVSSFIETLTQKNPMVSPDFLKSAVEAVINVEKARHGQQLLKQLSQMSNQDITKLTTLLSSWNIDDVLSVMNEIDNRILVIEAIERVFEDKSTDELHTLHPLVLNSRWLFGHEFDSPMFASNVSLSTVINTLFDQKEYDLAEIENPRRRPDIICLKEYTIKAVCTDRADQSAGGVMKPDQILIIELKRGGFEITGKELSQASYYVRQIKNSGVAHSSAEITAFVVGAAIGDVDEHSKTSSGNIHVVTYGQLIATANHKLFRLRDQLKSHYDSLEDESIVEKALRTDKQLKFETE